MTCRECKHWGDEYAYHRDVPMRHCNSPRIVYEFDGGKKPVEGGAMYGDTEGYAADFVTTSTFHCSCFESKGDNP